MRLDLSVAATRAAVRDALADLQTGDLVLVACSGGADSLALLAAACFEAPRAGLRVGCVTVDHRLQPGSAEQAARVAEQARQLDADPAVAVAVTVGDHGGPEAAARVARYAALDRAAEEHGAVAVLLGHTLDDQAETVLLGLARGSGARSLAGMAPVNGRYRRPFLAVDRATARRACAAQRLTPYDDPHNADAAFTRVKVRTLALPALTEALGRGVPEALARTADLLRADADALDTWAERARAEATTDDGGLDATALAQLPPAVRGRVLRSALVAAGVPAGALTSAHVRRVEQLVIAWRGQGPVALPGLQSVIRRCGTLHVEPTTPHDRRDPGEPPRPTEEP